VGDGRGVLKRYRYASASTDDGAGGIMVIPVHALRNEARRPSNLAQPNAQAKPEGQGVQIVLPFLARRADSPPRETSKQAVVGLRLPQRVIIHPAATPHCHTLAVVCMSNCTPLPRRVYAFLGHMGYTRSACLVVVFAARQGSNHTFLRLRQDQRTHSPSCHCLS
jgi:hypothetical protein